MMSTVTGALGVCWILSVTVTHALLTPSSFRNGQQGPLGLLATQDAATSATSAVSLDIVLFGVGDLRVDDHLGLHSAMASSNGKDDAYIVPLFVLTNDMLSNIPGVVAHTVDTAQLLAAALDDLDDSLRTYIHPDMSLSTIIGNENDTRSISQILQETIEAYKASLSTTQQVKDWVVRVRMCDLGDADNQMRYSPLGQLLSEKEEDVESLYEIVRWSNALREQPWLDVKDLSPLYPTYEAKHVTNKPPMSPVSFAPVTDENDNRFRPLPLQPARQSRPSAAELTAYFVQSLELDATMCQLEANTGLYATHWGGLAAASIGSQSVRSTLNTYIEECGEDDEAWSRHPSYTLRTCTRNGKSLEHASMAWQLAGDGTSPTGNVQTNWLACEAMSRYLAAPLLFGTISPRRVWHSAQQQSSLFFANPLQRLVEGQEWHRLLAARNLQTDALYQADIRQSASNAFPAPVTYGYWRYHGFLCRYAVKQFEASKTTDDVQGVLLVHGFGASGTQWTKALDELSQQATLSAHQGLAPDLIGFGQSEKPAISYTGYMWDSQMMDFVKEVAIHKHKWTSFITGGNSIGGFTSMSLAACDSSTAQTVSSTGAPGTGRCVGLVLMNSAGPVKTASEIESEGASMAPRPLQSVAQATAMQALPVCKPPPRPVARVFGNVLLGYLRPRIQSICRNLYPTNPTAVDAQLGFEIERDSLDPGAINVMMAGAKLPPPRTANELLGADFGGATASSGQSVLESCFSGPVLIAQGVLDPLNNSTDRMYRYQGLRSGIEIDPIPAGHCPHDELPDQVARSIAAWMLSTVTKQAAKTSLVGRVTTL